MNGYFKIIEENEKYEESIWPIGIYKKPEIILVGSIKPFKIFWRYYQRISDTFNKYPIDERNYYFHLLGLTDDERVTTQPLRTWRQLSFGVCWRATLAAGLLEKKRIISIPNYGFAQQYWKLDIVQNVWNYLLEEGYIILVSVENAIWIKLNLYPLIK
jgi:hypothetical protein